MHLLAAIVVAALFAAQAHPARSGYLPEVNADDGEAAKALAGIVVPEGFRVELFAAEPHCANLVALDVDPMGRCYVVETFRRDQQVLDMRDWPGWLEDDLACRTVADRVAMIKKHAGANVEEFRKESERVRLLRDRDGDGRVDSSTVFADGFNDYADGIAAGVLVRRNDVYFANMPSLWRLRDRDGDGVADQREALSTGYGVHFNFVGHDLHGLRLGPDGRLWFSLGDRGLDVVTKEGRHLRLPDTGAVLRCELDGSNLELVHTGLRNPQELAFDDAGDLFTCDNNSDSGDHARLVHVIEGGDSGWRVGWQWLEGPTPRGPWNSEKMWQPRNEETRALQPAFIVPCVTNLVSGPSGLAHEPGTAFPSRYRDHFFVCDFEAQPENTRVVAFSVKRKGAGFELASEEAFVSRGIVATDCDFAADGCMYVSDWVGGWAQPKRGRVWRIFDPAARAQPIVAETRDLLRQELGKYDSASLMQWLGHADQRVRMEAQFGLAARGDVQSLRTMARLAGKPLARIHAIWALGQIARTMDAKRSKASGAAIDALRPLLRDGDAEVRAQTAKVLGECGQVVDGLIALLADREPRPRFFAAIALGRIGDPHAVEPLIALVERSAQEADLDVTLRHAAVMGLAGCASTEQLVALAGHSLPAVRMAVLLAMRRRALPELVRFLDDRERPLVVEAARAIHDLPIESGLPELALAIQRNEAADVADGTVLPLLARSIDANFRLGGAEQAQRLARVAAERVDLPESVRADALRALTDFDAPPARDRVLGVWRPCAAGRAPAAADALQPQLRPLLAQESDLLRELAIGFIERHRIAGFEAELLALVLDEGRASGVRVAALNALAALAPTSADPSQLRSVVEAALASADPKLRGAARNVLAQLDPADALGILAQALERGAPGEQQDAYATLGTMDYAPATGLLGAQLERLLAGEVAPDVKLDLLEAADKKKGDPAIAAALARFEAARAGDDPLAAWRECERGGDPARGRQLFLERNEFQCMKCHRVAGEGAGEVGPDVAGVAKRGSREYLLESIVLPNRKIAVGFTNSVFVLADGDVVDGRVIGETPTHWLAVTTDRGTVKIRKSAVTSMRNGLSAMPNDLVQRIGKRELRDLVAWLATLE